jgi:hypothetical protein
MEIRTIRMRPGSSRQLECPMRRRYGMTGRPFVAALEGPCCAGKTTLARVLLLDLPGLTVAFVYLNLPQDVVRERNNGKFPSGSIYLDATFNAAIRSYFLRLADQESSRVAWLDATLDPAELARLTRVLLRQMIAGYHTQGAV